MFVKLKSQFDLYVSSAVRKMRIAKEVTQADLSFELGASDGFISQA